MKFFSAKCPVFSGIVLSWQRVRELYVMSTRLDNSSWRTWSSLRKTQSNNLSSALSVILSAVCCDGYSPECTPRRRNASTRWRSVADAKPHLVEEAYSFATTTDLQTCCRAVTHKTFARNTFMAYSERAHELMMLLTCSLTDSLLEMVTPSTFKDLTRAIPGSGGGGSSERLFLLSENTISADFDQFSARLFLFRPFGYNDPSVVVGCQHYTSGWSGTCHQRTLSKRYLLWPFENQQHGHHKRRAQSLILE